ncbi:hypothetical protein [Dactylosporangium sp. NPDC051541]|uniref:hypothetical protein n=1 Tax=Dactylosporangium sp. NPDC051541 TaxID=3363977 RepID=UPI003793821E
MTALLALELRTQWRQGIPAVILGLAAIWSGLVALWPPAAPYVIFVDTVTVGTLYAGALTISDRATGIDAALAVTPTRAFARVAARIVPLTVVTTAGAALIQKSLTALPAVALSCVLLLGVAMAVAARRDGFVAFMVALPLPMVLLLAVPLAVSIGLLHGPLWYAVPTTGALELIIDPHRPQPAALAYLALVAAVAAGVAARRPGSIGRRAKTAVDLPVVIALSPLLLALALRFGWPPFAAWFRATRGVDLAPYGPVLAIGAVAVHVPMSFGMTGALVILDDLEDGALRIVHTSPLGIPRYLARRLVAVTLLSAAGLAVAAPLSGLVPASATAAIALAVPVAPLVTVATLAVARTRVQGATADKVLAVPVYLPIAGWWLSGATGWWLAPLPTYWIVRTWDATGPPEALVGLAVLAGWLVPLTGTALRRLTQRSGP